MPLFLSFNICTRSLACIDCKLLLIIGILREVERTLYRSICPRSPTARVHVAAGGNIIGKQFPMMAKCRGDGREPPQRVQRAGVAVLWCWACDAFEAPPSTTPGASLPPLGAPALPPREALQGILGYENHPTYVYLARSQAQN